MMNNTPKKLPLEQTKQQLLQDLCQHLTDFMPQHDEEGLAAEVEILQKVKDQLAQKDLEIKDLSLQLVQSERTRSLGTLSSGVAHHFNNLLSVILGYSSFILNREELSKEAQQALQKVSESAQRGRRMTEELLAFAGSEAEEEKPCPVHDTITNVLALLASQMPSQVHVETQLDAAQSEVVAIPSAIHQIVFNLITNALDDMPASGQLRVSTDNVHVQAEDGSPQDYLRIRVTDNHEQAEDDQGNMKLSNVYNMVGTLSGTVVSSTQPDGTTTVEILMPVGEKTKEQKPEVSAHPALSPSTIWVVDDNPTFREMCSIVLSEDGHTISEITGGSELHEKWKAKTGNPDLIIIDFSMPDYNGLELCEWLVEHDSDVPVVLVSGLAENHPGINKALSMRKTYFLQKPFSFRDLTDVVTVAMGESLINE